jgi:hypothetical protein
MKMNFTAHIVIERPREQTFLWMFQPQHIIQLVTLDPTRDIITSEPTSPGLIEQVAKMRRFQEQAKTEIEIENLAEPTLHVGTTFQYKVGVRSQSEEFPAWRLHAAGTITIQKSTPPTFFTFTTRGISLYANHRLTFQEQQEKTIITYHQSTRFGAIQFMIASAIAPGVITSGNEFVRQQLLHLKTQMEDESL